MTLKEEFDSKRLNVAHAVECFTHRMALIADFGDMTQEEQTKFIAENDIGNLMRVGSHAEGECTELSNQIAYASMRALKFVDVFVSAITDRLIKMGYTTEEEQFAFAISHYTPEERELAIKAGIIPAA